MRICVFCGSATGWRPEHGDAARELGRALARRRIGLVNGGGRVGLMGATTDGALELAARPSASSRAPSWTASWATRA